LGRHRFFVNKIADNKAEITGEDFTHAATVLRLEKGDTVNVFNYEHGEFEAIIDTIDDRAHIVTLKLGNAVKGRAKSASKITAIVSLIKKDKMELMLEKLTELGVDMIVPLITRRTVIVVKDEEKKNDRWEKIIYSAVKQCGRLSTPGLLPVVNGVENIDAKTPDGEHRFFIYEKEENKFLLDEAVKMAPGDNAVFVIGPEGGFDEREADIITGKGFIPVSIGDTILRAETAAISAASVLVQALRRSSWK
jgi:16S rRNA (uracil1498-N3)-methyltransferase